VAISFSCTARTGSACQVQPGLSRPDLTPRHRLQAPRPPLYRSPHEGVDQGQEPVSPGHEPRVPAPALARRAARRPADMRLRPPTL